MRAFLRSRSRWSIGGWLLPLVLLALPNCFLDATGYGVPDEHFDPGDEPLTSAIMCDIPKVPAPGAGGGDCATAADLGAGMSMSYAAIALNQGEQNSLALDFSEAATSACGGFPKKTEFHGPFPDGSIICLNCAQQIPGKYADGNAACVAKCVDLVKVGEFQPAEGAESFCQARAKVSTNFSDTTCLGNVCSNGGTPNAGFVDPRREQEPVTWTEFGGDATAVNNDLSKLTGVPGDFDSGAASDERIKEGDAWVEFEAKEGDVSHVLGVSHDATGTDTDPTLASIGFAISLNYDNNIYILEDGANIINGPFGTYSPGERFRIRITDNHDGTATISYVKISGTCTPGTICTEIPIATQTMPSPSYPLRVDASLREPGATISKATLVRIHDVP
jgi:hypothetical protein